MTKESILDRDRLSVLTGAILLALSMTRLLEVPIRPLRTEFLGSQLGVELSATTIMELIMLGLGITAAESLVRSHPIARQGNLDRSTMYWIVPGMLVTVLATWLVSVSDIGLWTAGILASMVLVPLALAVEYAAVDHEHDQSTLLQWGQTVLIHLLAFIVFSRIYDVRARSLLSGTAVLIITTLLAARLYWPIVGDTRRGISIRGNCRCFGGIDDLDSELLAANFAARRIAAVSALLCGRRAYSTISIREIQPPGDSRIRGCGNNSPIGDCVGRYLKRSNFSHQSSRLPMVDRSFPILDKILPRYY